MELEIRDDRQMRALTGLTQAQFAQLLPTFSEVYQAKRQVDYAEAVQGGQPYITGAKKCHTLKNTLISTTQKVIVFLGYTFPGHHHDYKMLKEELSPELDWFVGFSVLVDLGYLGLQTDYAGEQIEHPDKKPRKSRQQPDTCMTDDQKADNKALSHVRIRIVIEHAIGGIKRYNILVDRFRNHRQNFQDDVIAISAALWNFPSLIKEQL